MANYDDPHKDNYKWPWSVTDREFGALEQELKELRHDFRNLKHIVDNSGVGSVTQEEVNTFRQNVTTLNQNIDSLRRSEKIHRDLSNEMIKLKIKVYTAFSVIGVLGTIIIWLVDVAFKALDNIN
jgi:hypothetical protein